MSDIVSSTRPLLTVRGATLSDMPAIAAIYALEVTKGVASFEEVPPDPAELNQRRMAVEALNLPYLVAERGGEIAGYCYASSYRARPAYRFTIENSVYVGEAFRRMGVAELLLADLIARCADAGRRQMIAVIALERSERSNASIALHEKLGFRMIGKIEGAGFKHGRWIDSVLMQRALGEGSGTLPPGEAI